MRLAYSYSNCTEHRRTYIESLQAILCHWLQGYDQGSQGPVDNGRHSRTCHRTMCDHQIVHTFEHAKLEISKVAARSRVCVDSPRNNYLRVRYASSVIEKAFTPVTHDLCRPTEYITRNTKVEWTLKEVTEPSIGSRHWPVGMLGI